MPIVVTFDIEGAPPIERNRIQSFFERFGWQNLGGSSYRFPKLGTKVKTEDWFNCVIPALMLFRSYLVSSGRPLSRFTLDAQSSTGYDKDGKFGSPALPADKIQLCSTTQPQFGAANLKTWMRDIGFPYPRGK